MEKALEGIRVIDLSSHLAGPFCTMQLADLGAEVIKIEPPRGDLSRLRVAPEAKGQAPYFLSVNRNKKGLILNLKSEEALNIFYELVKISDVIVENYRPGVTKSLGVDYDTVKKINPRIVYASISGFGQTGPYSQRPSFDYIAQAMSGMMHLSGQKNDLDEPVAAAGSIGDTIPALFATVAILASLYYVRKSGRGQYIDIAQVHSCIASMPISVQTFLITGNEEEGAEKSFPMQTLRGIYQTRDGYVAIAALYQFMEELVRIIGEDYSEVLIEWNDKLSLSRETHDKIVSWFMKKTNKEVDDMLQQTKIPYSLVLSLSDLVNDPQVKGREMFVQVEHPLGFTYKTVSSPMKMTITPPYFNRAPPIFGQDTNEILLALGYNDEKIVELRKGGVIM